MVYSVLFTRAAEEDRDQIVDYLLRWLENRQAARHFLNQLDMVIELLETFPQGSPQCEEPRLAALGYRKISFTEMDYVAIFKVINDTVTIARIFHTRQNYAQLL